MVKGTSGPKASGTSLSADPFDLPTKSKFSIKSLESSYQIALLEGIHSTQGSGSSVLTSGMVADKTGMIPVLRELLS